jgi:hypothetical protein
MSEETGAPMRTRIAAGAAAVVLGIAGLGAAGCGDDDNEGPAEEAGQAIDEGVTDATDAAEDAANSDEVQEAGDEIDEAADDAGDAAEEGLNEASTDDDN